MSTIYFHSPSGDAELRGAERHWLAWSTNAVGIAMLDLAGSTGDAGKILPLLQSEYKLDARFLASSIRVDGDRITATLPDGRTDTMWNVVLNTCLKLGAAPLRLAARLHAQCEIHCWVDGKDRAWLASIIEHGRAGGLYRAEMGWEDVITLLRARNDEPAVCSHSSRCQFPNRWAADFDETWDCLPWGTRWSLGMDALRSSPKRLQLTPTDFDEYYFGNGLTAFDLVNAVNDARRAKEGGKS